MRLSPMERIVTSRERVLARCPVGHDRCFSPAVRLRSGTGYKEGVFMASTKAGMWATIALVAMVFGMATMTAAPRALAEDAEAQAKALKQVERELHQLRADRTRDRKLIENLERKLDEVETQDRQVRTTNDQLQTTTQ